MAKQASPYNRQSTRLPNGIRVDNPSLSLQIYARVWSYVQNNYKGRSSLELAIIRNGFELDWETNQQGNTHDNELSYAKYA